MKRTLRAVGLALSGLLCASLVLPAGGAKPADKWYESTIAPILAERCTKCHGAKKRRNRLALHTPAAILAGGINGPVIVAGNANGSELVRRLRLPLQHDDHMPPPSKSRPTTKGQPTTSEIGALERWIAAGASFDAKLPKSEEKGEAREKRTYSAPPAEAVAALVAEQVHVELLDPEQQLLWIDFAARPDADYAFVMAKLMPLVGNIGELSLAGTAVDDTVLELMPYMPRLERLDLSGTACTGAGLVVLEGHPGLRHLSLTRTRVDASALTSLGRIDPLERLYLWRTEVTEGDVVELRAARPELLIDLGAPIDVEPVETDGTIVLSRPAGKSVSLKPVNAQCPVSKQPIDPKFSIVHEERVVAFCCGDCVATFWKDATPFTIVEAD